MNFYVTDKNRLQPRQITQYKGDVQSHTVDFSSWAEDNSDVTDVTWTVESGQASIIGESLASNVATINLTTSESGHSMIKATATDGTNTKVVYIRIRCRDPQAYSEIPDYGLISV